MVLEEAGYFRLHQVLKTHDISMNLGMSSRMHTIV